MADNITAPAAGAVLATDEISGVHYPRTKISFGPDGSAVDVSDAAPLPVSITGTMAVSGAFYQATQPVSVAALPLPAGATTAAKQDAIIAAIAAATYYPVTQPVSGTFWQATQPISGNVGVTGSVAVTGAFFQATQPISAATLPLPTGAATAANQTAPTPAGENYIGKNGGDVLSLSAVPVTAAGAYATGEVIGTKMTFANAVRVAAGAGLIQSVTVHAKTAQTGAVDLLLFSADPTASTFTDNAALAVNVADFDKLIGVVQLTGWISLGTPSIVQALQIALPFKLPAGTTIYGVLVARSAPTLGSTSDLTVAVRVIPG